MSNGCEPNEVIIAGLPPGAAFEVVLSHTTSVYGIVRKQLAGSTLVDTVTNQNEHVQFECPVIHHKEVADSEEWLTKIKGESRMAKEKKVKAPKKEKVSAGRKPTLAPFVDAPFKIYATYKGKDYSAQVFGTGKIVFEEKEYTSPSQVGKVIVGAAVNGFRFWSYNKNDKRVSLNEIRGSQSPLAAPKEKKPRKSKAKKSEAVAA